MPKKILVFYSLSGGGHYQAAKSLATDPTCEYILIDIGQFNPMNKWIYGELYTKLIEEFSWIWVVLNLLWKLRICRFITYQLFKISNSRYFKSAIETHQPDTIVSTYFYCARLANSITKKSRCITFVTELYGASPVWFDSKNVEYICCDPRIIRLAQSLKIPDSNLHLFTQYFNPKFNLIPKPAQLKQVATDLSLDSRPLILITGGGNSLPRGFELISKLMKTNLQFQFVVVCGRNSKLESTLLSLTKSDNRFVVLGFTNQLQSLINLSTLIITKAGPAIVTEIASQHKPMLLYSYIWPQEKDNVEFVINNGLGEYEPNLARLIRRLQTPIFDQKTNIVVVQNSIRSIIELVSKN